MLTEYVTFEGRRIMEVRCKGECKAVIVRREKDGLRPTPEYCELVIALVEPNGVLAKHETGVCKYCKQRILTNPRPGELDAIYAQDIYQMIEEAVRFGMPRTTATVMAERLALKTPVRALNEKGRGEA